MYNISEEDFKKILQDKFRALVGVSCKRIELLRDRKDISTEEKFNLLRDLIKELDWEASRDLKIQIKCFTKGLNYFKINSDKSIS